jgi:hypothetical protein
MKVIPETYRVYLIWYLCFYFEKPSKKLFAKKKTLLLILMWILYRVWYCITWFIPCWSIFIDIPLSFHSTGSDIPFYVRYRTHILVLTKKETCFHSKTKDLTDMWQSYLNLIFVFNDQQIMHCLIWILPLLLRYWLFIDLSGLWGKNGKHQVSEALK